MKPKAIDVPIHDLHATTGVETEDVGATVGIACPTHANPSEHEEGKVDDNRPFVQRL